MAASGASRSLISLCILGAVALILGGGGRNAAIANLVVILTALLVLLWARKDVAALPLRTSFEVILLLAITLALPLMQLVPLPSFLWAILPGRDLVAISAQIGGFPSHWLPISVDPALTILAFAGLLPAFAIFCLGLAVEENGKRFVYYGILAFAFCGLFLGAMQLASGSDTFNLHFSSSVRRYHGFFANYNTAGIFLVVSLCLLVGYPSEHGSLRRARIAKSVMAVALVIGVVLSQSRSSMALLALPASLAILQSWLAGRKKAVSSHRPPRSRIVLALSGLVAAVLISLLVSGNVRISQSFDRFSNLEDNRPQIWEDGLASAARFWPIGSGMGTFRDVQKVEESLENLRPSQANRAHNDYLEVAVEAGLAGLLLIVSWIALCARTFWVRRKTLADDTLLQGIAMALLAIALQSLVDYPLRNQAMLCLTAFLLAGLFRQKAPREISSVV